MRPDGAARAVVRAVVMVLVVSFATACGSDGSTPGLRATSTTDPGPNPTVTDPGPNPTVTDPGPHDTSGGPFTEEGVLVLDPGRRCVTLETASVRLALRLEGYALGESGGAPALVDSEGVAVAAAGDRVIVAGYPRGGSGACGEPFDAVNLVSVLPAA